MGFVRTDTSERKPACPRPGLCSPGVTASYSVCGPSSHLSLCNFCQVIALHAQTLKYDPSSSSQAKHTNTLCSTPFTLATSISQDLLFTQQYPRTTVLDSTLLPMAASFWTTLLPVTAFSLSLPRTPEDRPFQGREFKGRNFRSHQGIPLGSNVLDFLVQWN